MKLTTRQSASIKLLLVIAAALLFMGTACDDSGWQDRDARAPTVAPEVREQRRELLKRELGLDQSGSYPTPQVNFVRPVPDAEPVESRIVK